MFIQKDIEVLKSILGVFFKDQAYREGIERLRLALIERPYYSERWESIVRLVLMEKLPKGKALYYMDNDANLPLHENTNDEAYKWLVLMIINASKPIGSKIFDYKEFLDPDQITSIN